MVHLKKGVIRSLPGCPTADILKEKRNFYGNHQRNRRTCRRFPRHGRPCLKQPRLRQRRYRSARTRHRGTSGLQTERLDYRPNPAGIALAAQRKNVKLGILLFDTKNPFFEEVWKGVLEKEEELAGYNCTVFKKSVGFSAQEQLAAMEDGGL